MSSVQSMLSALAPDGRVAIGHEPIAALRALSDARALRCPLCEQPVVLRAGSILAPHFAHLPGAACSHRDAEPETDRHREGKALLARWLLAKLPEAEVTLEAVIAETGQRADLLIAMPDGARAALEYQCADLGAREWRRRHLSYRSTSIRDLWILGGSRLVRGENGFHLAELERALLDANAPLLFLDPLGEHLPAGTLARLRPRGGNEGAWIAGSLSARPLEDLEFPWKLLDWPAKVDAVPAAPARRSPSSPVQTLAAAPPDPAHGDAAILRWLRLKHGVTEEGLPSLFGMDVRGAEAFGCSARAWQAAVYYRWIHGRVGEPWWLEQVNVWARKQLPLAVPTGRLAPRALSEYQELLAAAGFLSLPRGEGRAKVEADLNSLGRVPERAEVERIAAYRRTLRRNE